MLFLLDLCHVKRVYISAWMNIERWVYKSVISYSMFAMLYDLVEQTNCIFVQGQSNIYMQNVLFLVFILFYFFFQNSHRNNYHTGAQELGDNFQLV